MEHITSKTNPLVKRYIRLRDQKKARMAENCFVVETEKLVKEAESAGVVIESLLFTEHAYEKHAAFIDHLLLNPAVHGIGISEEIEEKLTQTANARGLFAICKMLDKPSLLNTMKTGGRFLYLSQLQDSGNVGTIIRTALALGLSGVMVSPDCCDLYSMKVLRAAMGSLFRLPVYQQVGLQELAGLNAYFMTYAAVVEADAKAVTSFSFAEDSIVVIGNEGNGLSDEVAALCKERITISMKGAAESLNAGMAAGILMWELMKN